jgi:hypothetical protein
MEADKFAGTVSEDPTAWDFDYEKTDDVQYRKEMEAWYEKQWNEARVLAREA